MERTAAIKFCVKLKKMATETFEKLKSAYGEECLSRTSVFEWHKKFKEGRESLQDDERKDRPSTSRTEELVTEKQTVNGTFYKEVIKRLLARVHGVRPEFQESGSWYLLHDNAPEHSSGVFSDFLAKRGIPVLSHPPYTPDLGPTDFFIS
jgi:transposase